MTGPQVPPMLWNVLDDCAPSLKKLESWLEAADRQDVFAYAIAYRNAAEALTEAVDELHTPEISEDGSEDFRNWAVAQGEATWRGALGDLPAAYKRHIAGENRWDDKVRNPAHRGFRAPWYIAVPIFEERFSEDLRECLDSVL
jgi:hypothetical protein